MQQPAADETDICQDDKFLNAQVSLLQKAIAQLSPQKRGVFELCKLQKQTYLQAAKELQISKHTLLEFLFGAIASFKDYIRQHHQHAAKILYLSF